MLRIRYKRSLCLVFLFAHLVNAQTSWYKYEENPVLTASSSRGISGMFDQDGAIWPFVIIEEDGILRMWYTGRNGMFSVGEAISRDGIHWYQSQMNPLLTAGPTGSFDETGIFKVSVVKDDEGYKMYYYTGTYHFPNSGGVHNTIGLAISSDGYTWTKYSGNPVLVRGGEGAWDDDGVWAPMVIVENHTYKMWYQGWNRTYSSVGYATSSDGIHWVKHAGNPVLTHGSQGEFDELSAGEPNVLRVRGRYHLFYTSADAFLFNRIGYAISQDGINWTKYDHNPVLGPDDRPKWDDLSTAAASVIFKDNKFQMWYVGWTGGLSVSTGYAVSSVDRSSSDIKRKSLFGTIPSGTMITGNYPNPFNPSTTVNVNVLESGRLKVVVYDVNGKEVKTLLDEEMERGFYDIVWDGRTIRGTQAASGTYFAQAELMVNGQRLIAPLQKMILMK